MIIFQSTEKALVVNYDRSSLALLLFMFCYVGEYEAR